MRCCRQLFTLSQEGWAPRTSLGKYCGGDPAHTCNCILSAGMKIPRQRAICCDWTVLEVAVTHLTCAWHWQMSRYSHPWMHAGMAPSVFGPLGSSKYFGGLEGSREAPAAVVILRSCSVCQRNPGNFPYPIYPKPSSVQLNHDSGHQVLWCILSEHWRIPWHFFGEYGMDLSSKDSWIGTWDFL
jgi:hypothetical protein